MSKAEEDFKQALSQARKAHATWAQDILVLWTILLVPMAVASAIVCYKIANS